MLSLADVGYDPDSRQWAYVYRHGPRTATFESEFSLIGERMATLLNAAKRIHLHARPQTIQKTIGALRYLARAIARFSGDSSSPQDWHDALVRELRQTPRSERTRWGICNHANSVIREAARRDGDFLRLTNPFERKTTSVPILEKEAIALLRRQAKEDAHACQRALEDPKASDFPHLIEEARSFANRNGGRLPVSSDVEWATFLARMRRETRQAGQSWTSRDLVSRLYATSEAIMPFFILLVDKLAGNVDAIAEMQRDCMTAFDNPVTGKRYLIDVPKPRSGENVPPYSVADYGPLSVPSIIRFVLKYTEPLVPLAAPEHRGYLFLVDTWMRNVVPLASIPAAVAFSSYKKARGITTRMTLNMLRPTRLVSEYERTLDPFRLKRIARHSRLSSLAPYLNHTSVETSDDQVIAGAQGAIVKSRFRIRRSSEAPAAALAGSLPSHLCRKPDDPTYGLDDQGLCANFLWPLNDRNFVMQYEPRTVAFLLRDHEALCEAEKRLPSTRFAALYAGRKRLIEERYLAAVPPEMMAAAMEILKQLPSLPRID